MRLAAQQAGREEELATVRRQNDELENEVADLQSTLELLQKQADALKEVSCAAGCMSAWSSCQVSLGLHIMV